MVSRFEWKSCKRKRRWRTQPPPPASDMYAYECDFCGGWHVAQRKKWAPHQEIATETRTHILIDGEWVRK